MKKKVYIKPSVQVIELRHQGALLISSGDKFPDTSDPTDAPEFDDWLG
ncbi:hypothetical protein PRMUPPPA20_26460 [Xylanibacter ruminicola]|uniref:Uncharacterized protein n=2 Tax=Xylanibacter ruminicola TaxID=839 RepID=D5EUT4_XYLR2|nr:hypothetical protein [Xylanibacter ruminicola]ADE82911.1 hypothetical protein PRU_2116 [Xylanibacter ruminicola 23]GJG34537.1 hypothetical protein PRMUPPPA20_26460 [Xylanibacter ruminicola]SEH57780.1 hypothetical protein SAMN02745192_0083 [Xylanibacter ruminicola]